MFSRCQGIWCCCYCRIWFFRITDFCFFKIASDQSIWALYRDFSPRSNLPWGFFQHRTILLSRITVFCSRHETNCFSSFFRTRTRSTSCQVHSKPFCFLEDFSNSKPSCYIHAFHVKMLKTAQAVKIFKNAQALSLVATKASVLSPRRLSHASCSQAFRVFWIMI